MTQAELDLARWGMVIGRIQCCAAHSLLIAVCNTEEAARMLNLSNQLEELCSRIHTGEIRGTDTGQA